VQALQSSNPLQVRCALYATYHVLKNLAQKRLSLDRQMFQQACSAVFLSLTTSSFVSACSNGLPSPCAVCSPLVSFSGTLDLARGYTIGESADARILLCSMARYRADITAAVQADRGACSGTQGAAAAQFTRGNIGLTPSLDQRAFLCSHVYLNAAVVFAVCLFTHMLACLVL